MDAAAGHDEVHLPQHADVGERVAARRRRCRRACRARSCRPRRARPSRSAALTVAADDRRHRRHAVLDHQHELVGVAAVHRDAGVGAEGDPHAGRDGAAQRLAGDADPPFDLRAHLAGDRRWDWRAAARYSRSRSTGSARNRRRLWRNRRMLSSSSRVPCSIESAPTRSARLMPSAPWAWTATFLP